MRRACFCHPICLLLAVGHALSGHRSERINPIDSAAMVYIPAGEFIMGSDPSDIDVMWKKFGWPDAWKQHTKSEQPARRVRLSGFWIYRDNVTVAQYRKFCQATGRVMPAAPEWGWIDAHPVVNVSWNGAKAYCSWSKSRLPYEAEWEYAARGGNTGLPGKPRTIFAWGNDFPKTGQVANVADISYKKDRYYNPNFRLFGTFNDSYTHSSPVDAFPANGYGIRDMGGNVWQWCEDRFEATYYQLAPQSNPQGPDRGDRRVLRGGAYDTPPEMTRLARRISNLPTVQEDEKGFRCVRPGPSP